jgi:hypothetical protein
MLNSLLNVLLNLACSHFVADFGSMLVKDIGAHFSFYAISSYGFNIRVMQAS